MVRHSEKDDFDLPRVPPSFPGTSNNGRPVALCRRLPSFGLVESRSELGGTHRLWLEMMPQFQPEVPDPLSNQGANSADEWIWTEESTILVMEVSLLEKQWFFSFKETILGQTFAIRQLVAQSVGKTNKARPFVKEISS